jgi:aminopeptidase S
VPNNLYGWGRIRAYETVQWVKSTIFYDDFETNKGWTLGQAGDTATAGQWQRGDPEDTNSSGPKQLGTTVSGTKDLVTGRLAGTSANAKDVDGGKTSAKSPPIALTGGSSYSLSFKYYLAHGSNSSSADYLRVKVAGSQTATVFQELGGTEDDDGVWATRNVSLSSFAGQTVRIIVEAADESGDSLVEAAIDDLRVNRQ